MRFLVVPLLALSLAAAQGEDLQSIFQKASQSLSSGDLPSAERGFQQVLESQPQNIGALGNLGVVYTRMGRASDAVTVYQRALKLAPADPMLHLNLGLAYLKQDDYSAAQPHFRKVVAANPNHRQARELLAATQIYTGDVDAAVKELEVLKNSGDSGTLYFLAIGYLKQGNREKSQQTIAELFRGVSAAQASFLAGRAYYESTLFEEALSSLEKARQLDAGLPGIDRELGKVYVSLRRFDDAKKSLEQAVVHNPDDPEAQYFLGATLVQEGASARGTELLEKAKAARPNFWGAYYYLGKAQLEEGRAAEAAALLEKAVDLKPDETGAWYLLARAERRAGRVEQARRASERLKILETAKRKQEKLGTMQKQN